jgi:hypothetical protein
VPWLVLLVGQVLSLIVVVVVNGDLGECFSNAALPTLAMCWLALAPLPVGIAALLRRRTLGLALLGVGLPLCVFSLGKVGCPGSVLPFDDSESGSVPISGWMLAAYLAVLACFGSVLALSRR